MKKISSLLLLTFSLTLAAEAPVGPPGPQPADPSPRFDLTFGNDGFGLVQVPEWDDLRTTWLSASLDLSPLALDLDYSMFTRRAHDSLPELRDDELAGTVGYLSPSVAAGPARIDGSLGFGALFLGHLLGLELQRGFHSSVTSVGRAIPETYATRLLRGVLTAQAGARASLDLGPTEFEGRLNAYADGFGRASIAMRAMVSVRERGPAIGFLWNGLLASGDVGPVLAESDAMESGLWILDSFSSAMLRFDEGYCPANDISTGSVSLSLGRAAYRATGGPRSRIEIGMPFGSDSYLVRYAIELPSIKLPLDRQSLSFILDRDSGWAGEPSATFSRDLALRYGALRVGLAASLSLLDDSLEIFSALGGGGEVLSSHSQSPARISAETLAFGPSAEFEAGLRFWFWKPELGDSIGVSASLACTYSSTRDALLPSLRMRILAGTGG